MSANIWLLNTKLRSDLVTLLEASGYIKKTRPTFWQVILAVNYLHESKIAHRDIKLENILVDVEGHAKLYNFSMATKVDT